MAISTQKVEFNGAFHMIAATDNAEETTKGNEHQMIAATDNAEGHMEETI